MDDEPTYLDMLQAELADYERRRAKAAVDLAEQPEYAAQIDRMWDHAIGVKKAQIEREQERATTIQP